MGKTGKWFKNLLKGKKTTTTPTKDQNSSVPIENPATPISYPPNTPKDKKRWSFRRSSATTPVKKEAISEEPKVETENEKNEQKKQLVVVAEAIPAAIDVDAVVVVDVDVAAAAAAAAAVEEAAAVKIQSVYRSCLARKALRALRGLVKLQALVRGHLVRKQATATLRCMQALVTLQARARVQRLRMVEDAKPTQRLSTSYGRSTRDDNNNNNRLISPYNDTDKCTEENIKIVEVDTGDSNGSYSNNNQRFASNNYQTSPYKPFPKQDNNYSSYQISPDPSAITEMSPRAYSSHFEDYPFSTAQSSPHFYSAVSKPDPSKIPFSFPRPDYESDYPSYMANTESSRAKARSQSAPKQRPETFERQNSVNKRRVSIEGRNVPRAMRMQRSSSHVASVAQNYQYPWSVKLDKSNISFKGSESGSTSTVMTTNTNYCRSIVSCNPYGNKY